MTKYLVIGVWDGGDNGRWADTFEADSPEEAEQMALGSLSEDVNDGKTTNDDYGLVVAGVVALVDGVMKVVA
jgi:hypothetical protein